MSEEIRYPLEQRGKEIVDAAGRTIGAMMSAEVAVLVVSALNEKHQSAEYGALMMRSIAKELA